MDPMNSSTGNQMFITFDFETHSSSEWFAVGVVVAEYPSGLIRHRISSGRRVPLCDFSKKNRDFWTPLEHIKRGLDAENEGTAMTLFADKKAQVCEFIREMHAMYPKLRPVCDNPGMDAAFLNQMLEECKLPPVTIRRDGSSAPILCTYSYARSMLGTTGGGREDTVESTHARLFAPFKKCVYREVDEMAQSERHIPVHDCSRTLSTHFKVLDIVRFYRLYSLRPELMMRPSFFSRFGLEPQIVQFI
jgi:hypothetical protein